MDLHLRPEQKDDILGIYELNHQAFGQDNEARLVDLLRQGDTFIPQLSIVCVTKHTIVGHILFTGIKIIHPDGSASDSLALAPMAVMPVLQHQGIGRRLITHGLNEARTLGFASVIVLGHKEYYPKFGFQPTTKWAIRAPFDVPAEVFMGLELKPNALDGMRGTVQYPKVFEMV